MKTISFSITDDEYKIIKYEARCKGMTPSGYARKTVFIDINKYPAKGIFTYLNSCGIIDREQIIEKILAEGV